MVEHDLESLCVLSVLVGYVVVFDPAVCQWRVIGEVMSTVGEQFRAHADLQRGMPTGSSLN
jgi:hypothetical protein